MPQAGVHGMVAQAVHKWVPGREWLMLGIVFGSLVPDADNLSVAVTREIGWPSNDLHRTFTHNLIAALVVFLVFWAIGALRKQARWTNFGLGLAIGVLLHVLLDALMWFGGISPFWPFPPWVNLWEGVSVPLWLETLMRPLEFLSLALFFTMLLLLAKRHHTDSDFLRPLRIFIFAQWVLFIIFLPLSYMTMRIARTGYGLFYLVSLMAALAITIRMRATVEAI